MAPSIGLYRRAWQLEAWFKGFGVPFDASVESRLPATKTSIRGAIFLDPGDGTLLERVIESAADPRDFIAQPERHLAVVEHLNKYLLYDRLRLERAGRAMRLVEIADTAPVTSELSAMAAGIDFDTVSRDLDRALRAAADDPEIAVTAACAVIESVCRSILVELKIDFPAKQDVTGLYRAIRDSLGLDPMKEGLAPEIVNDVKAVLSGLTTTVQSIGALRTHAGSAHGKERGYRRIDARGLVVTGPLESERPNNYLPCDEKNGHPRPPWIPRRPGLSLRRRRRCYACAPGLGWPRPGCDHYPRRQ
ncbi:abortive infection family protein [Mesorhizobium salmacidum]|uniref:Abortive infection family protein n=1 Tax=Mesorhizobium salmacidum TaxID=3015171 RepID=A0ABU8L6A4_9HYPH